MCLHGFLCFTNSNLDIFIINYLLIIWSSFLDISSSFLKSNQFCSTIVVIADPKASNIWIEDASIASVIIQLSAQSLGLGSCWIQVRERFSSDNVKTGDYIKEVLGIPDKYSVECMIAIGYPDEEKKPYEESGLLYGKIHYDGYLIKK